MSEKSCAQLEILMNVFSVITMVICVLFGRSILGCLFGQIEHDVMEAAHTYLVVSGISFVFLGVYNTGGVWLGMFVDWYVRGISYSLRFLSKKWLTKKVI